jgi:hypothetical protein
MVDVIVSQEPVDVKSDVLDEIGAVRERNRKDYEAIAAMTDRTIAEVEADLTAPDPCFEADYIFGDPPKSEECGYDGCHEPVFRESGLCFGHVIEEDTAKWDDQDAERRACLAGVGLS